jgi:xanthine dehydrogenase YagS FAD-binding subunit
MKLYEYASARTEEEALALAVAGRTEFLAGGTDLVPLLTTGVVETDRVVYIDGVESMRGISVDAATGELVIGAVVHLDDLAQSPYLDDYHAIRQAIDGISSMQLIAQGTLGGEICRRPMCWYYRTGHGLLADNGRIVVEGDNRYHAILGNQGPAKFVHASRIAPALVALGGRVRILAGAADEARFSGPQQALVPVETFYRTPKREGERATILPQGGLLTHVILPPANRFNATYEVRHGEGPDMPLAAAAAALDIDGGVVRAAKIVLGQVAPVPWVSHEAAGVLVGRRVTHELADEAGWAAVSAATPLSDNEYKVQLAAVAVKRAILTAAGIEI